MIVTVRSQAGTYRKILHRPKDLTHRLIRYTSPDHPLARADEDVLLNIPLEVEAPPFGAEGGEHESLAVQVELTLATSTYATMALREVLKTESGAAAQREMTRKMNERFAGQAKVEADVEGDETMEGEENQTEEEVKGTDDAMVE